LDFYTYLWYGCTGSYKFFMAVKGIPPTSTKVFYRVLGIVSILLN
jgi:hypothetical protein